MAAMTAKINVKNMDYFKFKKIVIDGSRDDYESCSREIRTLCDSVQTLAFRDEHFADDVDDKNTGSSSGSDRRHFDEILAGYRLILTGKRIDPVDIRVKTGWWAEASTATSSCGSAGKFKSSALRETLLKKAADWWSRYDGCGSTADLLDRPGVFVLKHRERQCFQLVGRTTGQRGVFSTCADLLKSTFDGSLNEPIAALLVVSMAADWDFYYLPLADNDDDRVLRIVMNDVIIRHDALWPRGLNELLYVETPLEVAELRRSCLRHRWPPSDAELEAPEIQLNLELLRVRLQRHAAASQHTATSMTPGGPASGATATKGSSSGTRTAAGRTTPTQRHISPAAKSAAQHPAKSNLPSPTSRRPAPSTTAPNPTKPIRSRPQSAPKPPPSVAAPVTSSCRRPQPSAGTPRSRSQSAKSVDGKPSRSPAPGRTTSASLAETASMPLSDMTASVNGASLPQPSPNVQGGSVTSAAESSDVINTADCTTAAGCQQIAATV